MTRRRISLRELAESCGGNYSCLEKIYLKYVNGEIALRDPSPPRRFVEYLVRLDYGLDNYILVILYISLAVTLYLDNQLYYIPYIILSIYYSGKYVYEIISLYEKIELRPLPRLLTITALSLVVSPLVFLVTYYLTHSKWIYLVALLVLIYALYILSSYIRFRRIKTALT